MATTANNSCAAARALLHTHRRGSKYPMPSFTLPRLSTPDRPQSDRRRVQRDEDTPFTRRMTPRALGRVADNRERAPGSRRDVQDASDAPLLVAGVPYRKEARPPDPGGKEHAPRRVQLGDPSTSEVEMHWGA